MQSSKGRVMEGTGRSQIFRRVMGGTERSQIFSKGDGRNGTLADVFEGCWEERNARRFVRRVLGRTERSQISKKRRVVAWTSGRCDASACDRVSRTTDRLTATRFAFSMFTERSSESSD